MFAERVFALGHYLGLFVCNYVFCATALILQQYFGKIVSVILVQNKCWAF